MHLISCIRNITALLILLLAVPGRKAFAQATPDTTMKNVFPDTTTRQELRPFHPAIPVDTNNIGSRVNTNSDSTPALAGKPRIFEPNPKKAGLYSSIFPGMGQLYNKQYWKIPIIYAGIAVAGYYFIDNLNNYQNYRKAYIGRINNPYPSDPYPFYTTAQLQQLQNDYNNYLDYTILFAAIGYAVQVMDAIVAAHLKNFDVSRDISMRVQPVAMPNGGAGVGLVFNLK